MNTVILLSNRKLSEHGGRVEKYRTRQRLLKDFEWELEISYAPASASHIIPAVIRCLRLARRKNADVILSASNPWHPHVVGMMVAVLSGLPWIAEFRDPLVTIPSVKPGTIQWYARRILERITIHLADRVTWVNGIQLDDTYFQDNYPGIPQDKFVRLPFLGFEDELFTNEASKSYEAFTITYAGSFYEGWIEPNSFLRGLKRYLETHTDIAPGDIQVLFFGDWNERYDEMVEDLNLCNFIRSNGFVPHEEIIRILKGSDVALSIGGADPRNRLNVPSKIWDYIGARTPILALVDPSFRVADIVREQQLGLVADPTDIKEISKAIEHLRCGSFEYSPNPTVYDQYRRRRHVSALAEVLEETRDMKKS